MFDALGSFDQVYPDGNDPTQIRAKPQPLKRRKTLRECGMFIAANLVVLPVVALLYGVVVADGLRVLMPIFSLRLYKLPLPGAGLIRSYDGWDRLDLALIMSLLIFAVVTWLWTKIFVELQGFGTIADQRLTRPLVFYMLSTIAAVFILGDAMVFYVGITAQSASGWTESPWYVAPAATLLYCCGLAVCGWWHSDFKTSSLV